MASWGQDSKSWADINRSAVILWKKRKESLSVWPRKCRYGVFLLNLSANKQKTIGSVLVMRISSSKVLFCFPQRQALWEADKRKALHPRLCSRLLLQSCVSLFWDSSLIFSQLSFCWQIFKDHGTQNNVCGSYVLHRHMSQQVSCQNPTAAVNSTSWNQLLLDGYENLQVWTIMAYSLSFQIFCMCTVDTDLKGALCNFRQEMLMSGEISSVADFLCLNKLNNQTCFVLMTYLNILWL